MNDLVLLHPAPADSVAPHVRRVRLKGLPDEAPGPARRVSSAQLADWLRGAGGRPSVVASPASPMLPAEDIAALPEGTRLVVTALAAWVGLPALLRRRPDIAAIALLEWPWALAWPEYAGPGAAAATRAALMGLAGAATLVVADESSSARLVALAGGDKERTARFADLPVRSGLLAPAAPAVPSEPYVVAVGPIEARANSLLLLQLWRDGLARGLPLPRLVLAGARGAQIEEIAPLLDWNDALSASVAEAPGLPPDQLGALVLGATAVLAPDFCGPPLPLMRDALAWGVPVIAADAPEVRRLAPSAIIAPIDGPGWRNAVLAIPAGERRRATPVPDWPGLLQEIARLVPVPAGEPRP